MKLIVGLGNPGRKYAGTRHNVGFEVLGELARQHGTSSPREKFQGETVEATVGGERAVLLCPHTYMNKSGECVQPAKDFYKIEDPDLLVVCDDFNLPLARLRFRSQGSSGGQKGLQDIIRRLGTEDFSRLRIGIGTPPPEWDVADYVLSKFTKEEQPELKAAVTRAAEAVAAWMREGIDHCMTKYNGK
jgi:PTH1 family peptidyl-tRNA hydrolase